MSSGQCRSRKRDEMAEDEEQKFRVWGGKVVRRCVTAERYCIVTMWSVWVGVVGVVGTSGGLVRLVSFRWWVIAGALDKEVWAGGGKGEMRKCARLGDTQIG
jgi:hypothetical protein